MSDELSADERAAFLIIGAFALMAFAIMVALAISTPDPSVKSDCTRGCTRCCERAERR